VRPTRTHAIRTVDVRQFDRPRRGAAAHPNAIVVAHPRAIRHLADPSRLIGAVREASPDLFPLYGEPIPIPEDRLHAAADGERFEVGGGLVFEATHAPGHAPHHVCFFERSTRTLFAGDAAGSHGIAADVPLSVPPGLISPPDSRPSIGSADSALRRSPTLTSAERRSRRMRFSPTTAAHSSTGSTESDLSGMRWAPTVSRRPFSPIRSTIASSRPTGSRSR